MNPLTVLGVFEGCSAEWASSLMLLLNVVAVCIFLCQCWRLSRQDSDVIFSSSLCNLCWVRCGGRQDLLLTNNFTRQIEPSNISSVPSTFYWIDQEWMQNKEWIILRRFRNTKISVEIKCPLYLSVWNECRDPPLLPVNNPSLQIPWNVQNCSQSCTQSCSRCCS